MSHKAVIDMLRLDMRLEHQAIIQYLAHAYALEESGVAPDIEAIAREEMRHLEWLAEAIVELGGDPDMGREEPDLSSASPQAQMLKDVGLEEEAIRLYREHMEAIEDPKIRRLLARIVHDEQVHMGEFQGMAGKLAAGEHEEDEAGEEIEERLEEMLNYGVQHEYSVVLQYLFHSFVSPDCEEKDELQQAAINEMQHMGWLAEEVEENGGDPAFEHHDLFLSHDSVANLKANLAIEDEVTHAYSAQIPELKQADLRALLARIRDHEIYHTDVFRDLLQEACERQAAECASAKCAPATEEACTAVEDEDPAPKGAPPVPPIGSLNK